MATWIRSLRVAVDPDDRAGPDGDTRTAPAAFLVTHDIAPLRAIDVAVAIGKRGHGLVRIQLVARTDDMADLVRHGANRDPREQSQLGRS